MASVLLAIAPDVVLHSEYPVVDVIEATAGAVIELLLRLLPRLLEIIHQDCCDVSIEIIAEPSSMLLM